MIKKEMISEVIAPRSKPVEWGIALFLCVFVGLVLIVSLEFKGIYKIALLGGIGGSIFLIFYPKRRIVMVIGWILLHPLSIEKVFFIGEPLSDYFFPPVIVFSASDIMLLFLCIALLFEFLIKGNYYKISGSPISPYAALGLWAFFVFFLRNPDVTSGLAIVHQIKMIFFLFILTSSIRSPGELKSVLYAICAAVFIQVVIVGHSHFSESVIHVSSKIEGALMAFSGAQGVTHLRATGTVGHVNQEASYLTFFGFPLIALIFSSNKALKIIGTLTLMGCVAAIGLTFSRSAWLSVAFGSMIILLIAIKKKEIVFRHWLYALPFLLIGIAVLPVISKPVMDRVLHGDDGATASRKRAVRLALDLFAKHPITGVGAGNFTRAALFYYPPERMAVKWLNPGDVEREFVEDYGRLEINEIRADDKLYVVPLPVHNKYLLVLAELGIIGFVLFIWFQYRIFIHLKNSLKSTDTFFRWLAIGITGAFFASQCYMNLDLFSDDKTMEILLIVAVLAMVHDNIGRQYGFHE